MMSEQLPNLGLWTNFERCEDDLLEKLGQNSRIVDSLANPRASFIALESDLNSAVTPSTQEGSVFVTEDTGNMWIYENGSFTLLPSKDGLIVFDEGSGEFKYFDQGVLKWTHLSRAIKFTNDPNNSQPGIELFQGYVDNGLAEDGYLILKTLKEGPGIAITEDASGNITISKTEPPADLLPNNWYPDPLTIDPTKVVIDQSSPYPIQTVTAGSSNNEFTENAYEINSTQDLSGATPNSQIAEFYIEAPVPTNLIHFPNDPVKRTVVYFNFEGSLDYSAFPNSPSSIEYSAVLEQLDSSDSVISSTNYVFGLANSNLKSPAGLHYLWFDLQPNVSKIRIRFKVILSEIT